MRRIWNARHAALHLSEHLIAACVTEGTDNGEQSEYWTSAADQSLHAVAMHMGYELVRKGKPTKDIIETAIEEAKDLYDQSP